MSRPVRLRHAIAPWIAMPDGGGFHLALSASEGYDLSAVDHWLFELAPRAGAAPRDVFDSDTVAISGQVLTLEYALDDAGVTDDELTLGIVAASAACEWGITAYDDADALLWRVQGDIDFESARGNPDSGARSIPSPIEIDLGEGATLALTILGNAEASTVTVDNDTVNTAIEEDAAATRTALGLGTAATTSASAYAAASHTQAISTITGLQDALDAKAATASLGNAATKNSGEANGVASLGSDGKIPSAQLPAIAIVDYLGTAANEAAMLALTGQKGDWAQRTDLGTMWFITGDDPTQLASWREMTYPTAPVSSVAGLTGSIASGDLRTALGLATTSDVTFETLYASEYGDYATPSLAFAGTCGFLRNDNDVLYKNSNIAFLVFQHPGGFTMTDYYGPAPIRWGGLGNNGVVASYSLGIEKEAVGLLAVTSGTSGQYRDAKMRDLILLPSASKTPANNGELVVEATSNTSVTIKLKGSDGTVRSVALTLS